MSTQYCSPSVPTFLDTLDPNTLAHLAADLRLSNAHENAGFATWHEYADKRLRPLADKVVRNRLRRLFFVARCTRYGLSTRAIAPILGVSQSTVVNIGRRPLVQRERGVQGRAHIAA